MTQKFKSARSLKDDIESGLKQWKQVIRQQKLDDARDNKRALEDQENAKKLVAEIRVDLGLTAVKIGNPALRVS